MNKILKEKERLKQKETLERLQTGLKIQMDGWALIGNREEFEKSKRLWIEAKTKIRKM